MRKLDGSILEVDLDRLHCRLRPCPPERLAAGLGGRGLNVDYLYRHLPPGADPAGGENILAFACGLLTGTAAPAASRLHVNALSPLTGQLGSSNVGGGFGAALRSCGILQVVVRGRAPQPVYLLIDGGTAELRNAKALWGLTTDQTTERLRERLGTGRAEVLAIGPGGENGALFGCIMNGRHHAAGRTGMGTVMGGKRLKAVVVKAARPERAAREGGEPEAVKRYAWQIRHSPQFELVHRLGGAGYIKWADEMGIMPTRNYRDFHFPAADRLDGDNLAGHIVRRRGCRRCPIQCKAELAIERGKLRGRAAVRPEFEPIMTLGVKCGLADLDAVIHLDNLCSRLGLDSISAASTIAFAMDLWERGIIGAADTGGLAIRWGDAEAMEALICQMAAGEGFGRLLGQGVRRAAAAIGRGAERYAPHVKGLEMTSYHPSSIMGTALGYAVASRGADYNDVYAALEYKWQPERAAAEFGTPQAVDTKSIHGKAALVRRAMVVGTVLDSLGLCKVPALCLICSYDLVAEAELAAALTGHAFDAGSLFAAGERIVNLERLFNLRAGAGPADDRLPQMFFEPEYNAGSPPSKPEAWMAPMIREFYAVMGWDAQGRPRPEKLAELGIADQALGVQPAA